jgi:cell division septum initiation protein DivIVA
MKGALEMTATSDMNGMWFERMRAAEAKAEERSFHELFEQPRDAHESAAVDVDAAEAPSYAAARLLEIATGNADALVDDAREEADRIISQARARAEEQRVELDLARGEILRELEERRAELEAKVDRLVEFESRYRSHLVSYIDGQLETPRGPTFDEVTPAGP